MYKKNAAVDPKKAMLFMLMWKMETMEMKETSRSDSSCPRSADAALWENPTISARCRLKTAVVVLTDVLCL